MERPTGFSVIGWAWIVLGGLMVFPATMILIMYGALSPDELPADFRGEGPEVPVVFRYVAAIAVVQMTLGVAAIVGGIHFLRFKAWARLVLEILCWLTLLYVVVFFIFFVRTLGGLTAPSPDSFVPTMMIGMAVFQALLFSIPLVLMIRYLRSGFAREVIQRAASASAQNN